MDRAYIFPEGVEVAEDNVHRATPVTVGSPYDQLERASDGHRLVCRGCLGRAILVREPAGSTFVKCFRHDPGAPAGCLFRVDWTWPSDGGAPVTPRGVDPAKLIETLLRRQLQGVLQRRGGAQVSAGSGLLPELTVQGLRPGLRIASLAPGDEPRWRGFNGRVDGVEVLFFVAAWDLKALRGAAFDRDPLAIRPAIAVDPARPGSGVPDTCTLLPELGAQVPEWWPLAELDLARVDHGALFGSGRSAEYLWIRAPYGELLGALEARMAKTAPGSPLRRALGLLAKRCLVKGGGAHRAVFGQDLAAALRPLQLGDVFPKAGDLLAAGEAKALRESAEYRRLLAEEKALAEPFELLWRDVAAGEAAAARPGPTQAEPEPAPAPGVLTVAPEGAAFTSIAAAIAAAPPGARILVRPGVYEECLVVDRELEIVGEGDRGEIVVRASGDAALRFSAPGGRVANLSFEQAGGGDFYGVEVSGGRPLIEGCDLTSRALSCLAVHGAGAPRVVGNRIHDGAQSGVFVYDGGGGEFEDNEIVGCGHAGVSVKDRGDPRFRANRIGDGRQGGVFVYDNGRGEFTDNAITGNGQAGVQVRSGGNPVVRGNRVRANKQSGIFSFDGGRGVFEDNEIESNGHAGVTARQGGHPVVRRSRIRRNGWEAVRVYDGGGGTFQDNDLTGNERGPWNIAGDCELNVTRIGNREE